MSTQNIKNKVNVLDNPKWQTNQIASNAASHYKSILFFGLFWNGFLSVFLFFIWEDIGDILSDSIIAYVFILFPIVGIYIIYLGVKEALAWNKFGATPLVMDPFPGEIGDLVSGYVDVNIVYDPTSIVTVTLSCLRHKLVTHKNKSKYYTDTVWDKETVVNLTTSSIGSRVKFEFEVPEGLPESELESDLFHDWKFHIKLALKGLDLEREFDIPVMKSTQENFDRYGR